MKDKILIIGGYGKVGSIVSKHLAQLYPDQIIVAGRSIEKAKKITNALLNGTIPLEFDVNNITNFEILSEVKLVIMCIDQNNTYFVEACINFGIHYIDITADECFITKIEALNKQAIKNNSSVILSVGLAPGITNILVKHCSNYFPKSKLIDIFILLGSGEKHGEAAYRWTFDNLHSSYVLGNFSKPIRSFSLPKKTKLLGKRTFYTFNFSDQHTLSKTINTEKIITRMAFDSKLLTLFIRLLRNIGLTILFKNKKVQNCLIKLFSQSNIGSDLYAVKAVLEDTKGESYECSVVGNGEAKITAFVAVELANYLLKNKTKNGVNHVHNIVEDVPKFLENLKKYDSKIITNIKPHN